MLKHAIIAGVLYSSYTQKVMDMLQFTGNSKHEYQHVPIVSEALAYTDEQSGETSPFL